MIDPVATRHGPCVSLGALSLDRESAPSSGGRFAAPIARRREASESAGRFRDLVDAHFAFVWRSLRGLGVPHAAADDAAQQVFLVALTKIDAIAAGSERSFLFGTALGVAANARRADARRREVPDEDAVAARVDPAPGPEDVVRDKEARAALDAILGAMPIDLTSVFVLFELEGFTMVEIAGLLDLAPGTVASRLRRAREEFQTQSRRFQAGARIVPDGARGGIR